MTLYVGMYVGLDQLTPNIGSTKHLDNMSDPWP